MARVSVDEELLINLLDFKLSHLKEEIDRILKFYHLIQLFGNHGGSKVMMRLSYY